MKRFLGVLLVLVGCMCFTIPAQAQLQWGVKGGVNLAKLDYKDIKDNSTGFFIGPMAEATIPHYRLGKRVWHIHCRRTGFLLQLQGYRPC